MFITRVGDVLREKNVAFFEATDQQGTNIWIKILERDRFIVVAQPASFRYWLLTIDWCNCCIFDFQKSYTLITDLFTCFNLRFSGRSKRYSWILSNQSSKFHQIPFRYGKLATLETINAEKWTQQWVKSTEQESHASRSRSQFYQHDHLLLLIELYVMRIVKSHLHKATSTVELEKVHPGEQHWVTARSRMI